MDRALSWFIRAWVALAVLVNVAAAAGFFGGALALSFWDGWQQATDIYSPLNLTNWIAEMVLISPAFGAYLLLERSSKTRAQKIMSPQEAQQIMSPQEAQQIINAYGAATEQPALWPRNLYAGPTPKDPAARQIIDEVNAVLSKGSLRDIGTLPYPKERIKQALLIGIALTAGNDRELLRTGYVMLCDWQDPSVPDPLAAMVAEGKALLAELKAFEQRLLGEGKDAQVRQST